MSIMFKLPHADPDKVYRVTELTRLIRMVLEDDIGEVWLEGDQCQATSSGHLFHD